MINQPLCGWCKSIYGTSATLNSLCNATSDAAFVSWFVDRMHTLIWTLRQAKINYSPAHKEKYEHWW